MTQKQINKARFVKIYPKEHFEKYYFSASAKYIEYNQAPGANLPVS